jgi:hypothetical protein
MASRFALHGLALMSAQGFSQKAWFTGFEMWLHKAGKGFSEAAMLTSGALLLHNETLYKMQLTLHSFTSSYILLFHKFPRLWQCTNCKKVRDWPKRYARL